MVSGQYPQIFFRGVGIGLLLLPFLPHGSGRAQEGACYQIETIATSRAPTDSRSKFWKPQDGELALEVSGMTFLPDGRLAVAIRKGEIWLLDNLNAGDPEQITFQRFATALHEPLGLLEKDGFLYTAQRTELTRLRDRDGDDVADEYTCFAKGWGVTGHYHEYAYGPKLDGHGNLWITLNIGMGLKGAQLERAVTSKTLGYRQGLWRGWGLIVSGQGELQPMCAGMRSPSGIGTNLAGDMFYTDQQGNWVATNSLHHLREGVFYHHPEAFASMDNSAATIRDVRDIPNGLSYPEALKAFPAMRPPAVWFPYKKVGQSATDIVVDASDGAFGPFAGQLFVGEFTQAGINRVFLEKVGGQYQGACFPFRLGFASAVLRMVQGPDGSLYVGLTNRGWSSLGDASYGLQRLRWTGEVPFEIKEMHATPSGFELHFTQPIDTASAMDSGSYRMKSYTYRYHATYGSDEIDEASLSVKPVELSRDRRRVRLVVSPLRKLYVHELEASGIRSELGEPLEHPQAYYTLNQIPNE